MKDRRGSEREEGLQEDRTDERDRAINRHCIRMGHEAARHSVPRYSLCCTADEAITSHHVTSCRSRLRSAATAISRFLPVLERPAEDVISVVSGLLDAFQNVVPCLVSSLFGGDAVYDISRSPSPACLLDGTDVQ